MEAEIGERTNAKGRHEVCSAFKLKMARLAEAGSQNERRNSMSVSSILSSLSQYDPNVQSAWQQRAQDFKSLGDALQAGNLAAAQSACANFQQDLQSFSQAAQSGQPFSSNPAAATDFQTLQTSLQSGDISGAQQAFASLNQDMETGHIPHHHHHHPQPPSISCSSAVQPATTNTASAIGSISALLKA